MAHRLSLEAQSDLDAIWDYIVSQGGSIDVADRFLNSIGERILLLATHPHLGRSRTDDLREGVRSFAVGTYVILYRISDDDVLILRVLRGSRDIESLLR